MTDPRHTIDPRVRAAIEHADPLSGPAPTTAETEGALAGVWARADAERAVAAGVAFAAPAAGVGSRRRRRRVGAVTAIVSGAAVATGVVLVVGAGSTHTVATASAQTVLHRAAVVLAAPAGAGASHAHAASGGAAAPTILHTDVLGSQTNAAGAVVASWEDEGWEESQAPYAARQIETTGGRVAETATVGDRQVLYDRATNTVYEQPPARIPDWWIAPGDAAGSLVLRVPSAIGMTEFAQLADVLGKARVQALPAGATTTLTITDAQASALRAGTDTIEWRSARASDGGRGKAMTEPYVATQQKTSGDPNGADFRSSALALLRSPGAQVTQNVSVDGQPATRITSANGATTYYVKPDSSVPIRLVTRGQDGESTLRFRTYATLPATGGNRSLVSLAAQHPGAKVVRSEDAFEAAQSRLFPNG